MLEYVISCGEGTLIDFGVIHQLWELEVYDQVWPAGWPPLTTLMIQPCSDDCETGK